MEKKKMLVKMLPEIILAVIVTVAILAFMIYWAKVNDARMEQIAKDEAVAKFPAQVVTTTNGKKVFIWEKNGKVEGYVIEEEY